MADVGPKDGHMKIAFYFVFTLCLVTAARAGTNAPTIELMTIAVHATYTNSDSTITYMRPVCTEGTRVHLPEYNVFVASLDANGHPAGTACLLIKSNDYPVYVANTEDAAQFLSTRIKHVGTDHEAEVLFSLLADMFSYRVITNPPPRRGEPIDTPAKPADPATWGVVTEQTSWGWTTQRTLLLDEFSGLSFRVHMSVTHSGRILVKFGRKTSQYVFYQ